MNKVKSYYNKYFLFLIIVVAVLFQYGFHNFTRLGFITDDWANIYTIKNLEKVSFSSILEKKLSGKNGLSKFYRPMTIVVVPLQLILMKDNIVLHHLNSIIAFSVMAILTFIVLRKMFKEERIAFYITLFFISFPGHTATLFWTSTRITIYTFIFFLLSLYYFLDEKHTLWKDLYIGLLYFMAIANYEIFVAALPFIFIIAMKGLRFAYKDLVILLKRLIPFVFGLIMFFFYNFVLIKNLFSVGSPKEASFKLGFEYINYYVGRFISEIMGEKFFEFVQHTYARAVYLKSLNNFYLILAFLVLFSLFCFFGMKKWHKKDAKSPTQTQGDYLYNAAAGFVLFLSGALILIVSNYFFTFGSLGDRVNLLGSLGISIFSVFLLERFVNREASRAALSLIFILFTLVNLVYLTMNIKSYEYQRDFIEYVRTLDIQENSLIVLDTNIEDVGGVNAVRTPWGITYMLRNSLGLENIEYIGNSNSVAGKNLDFYQSALVEYNTYIKPNVYYISYFVSEIID